MHAHYLKPNHSAYHPSELLFVDTESYRIPTSKTNESFKLRFRLGCAMAFRLEYGRRTRQEKIRFTKPSDFWDFVEGRQSHQRPVWLWAHNIGHDLTQLDFWGELERRRYVVSSLNPLPHDPVWTSKKPFRGKMVLEGRPTFMKLLGHNGVVRFTDSGNYFMTKLATLGALLDVPKMEMPNDDADDETWFAYCERDVEILTRAVCLLLHHWRTDHAGVWQSTAAGLALTSWRHLSPTEIGPDGKKRHVYPVLINPEPEPTQLEREGYYGGYIGAFYVGKVLPESDSKKAFALRPNHPPYGPIYHLDVRSLYPWIMRENYFPMRRVEYRENWTVREFCRKIPAYGGMADVTVSDWKEEYPVTRDGHLTYCTGRFRTVLCGAELERAVKLGHVHEVHRGAIYTCGPIFREWVDFWWKRRLAAIEKGDTFQDEYCKLILNSLSGKFGQKPLGWCDILSARCRRRWGVYSETGPEPGTLVERRGIAGNVQEKREMEESSFSFPAISAFITSAAREHMRMLRNLCPEKTIFHQAVDGLLVDATAFQHLNEAGEIAENQLGKLSLKKTYMEGEIFGHNHWQMDEAYTCSGNWGKSYIDKEGRRVVKLWDQLRSIISVQPNGEILVTETEIETPEHYPKGKRGEDGWYSFEQLVPTPEVFQSEKIR